MRRKTTMSLSRCVAISLCVFVCLMVPTVYTLPVSTFAHCYQSHFCGIKSSLSNGFSLSLVSAVLLIYSARRKPTRFCKWEARLTVKKVNLPSTNPQLSLTCFLVDLWQLGPYLGKSVVSVLGDKDIFSFLEQLEQKLIIFQFNVFLSFHQWIWSRIYFQSICNVSVRLELVWTVTIHFEMLSAL